MGERFERFGGVVGCQGGGCDSWLLAPDLVIYQPQNQQRYVSCSYNILLFYGLI